MFPKFFYVVMFHFPVHQVDDGPDVIMDVLQVNPLAEHPGYDLAAEDPDIYSDDEDKAEVVTLRQEWEHNLDMSDEQALLIKKTLQAHHFNAKLLESFGVNACKQYKLIKAEAALNAVQRVIQNVVSVARRVFPQ